MTDFQSLDAFFTAAKGLGLSPVGVLQKDAQISGKGWQNGVASLHPRADGVGIITSHAFVALDFDDAKDAALHDRATSDALLGALLQRIPGAAVRRGDPTGSKWLVPVRTKTPCTHARTLTDSTGRRLQIIANKGQFVAFGSHDSVNPFGLLNEYSWSNGDALVALRDAPEVSDVIALAAALGFTGAEPGDVANMDEISRLKPTDTAVQAMVKSKANAALEAMRERGRAGMLNGTSVMATASKVAPAVHWGLLTEDEVVDAACAHGRNPDDNDGRGGRTYREEVSRGLNSPLDSHDIIETVRAATPAASTFDHIDPSVFQAASVAAPIQAAPAGAFAMVHPLDRAKDSTNVWVVKNLIRRGWIASIYAPPKAGKSTMTTDLAFHVALGKRWCGLDVKRAVPVLYVTERLYQIRTSMRALAARHEIGTADLPVEVLKVTDCNIMDPQWRPRMDATMEAFRVKYGAYPGLIVFDTLAKLSAGAEENSAKDMGTVNAALRGLQAAYGDPAMATVGHTGKAPGKGERGSNSTMGDRDVGIEVILHEETDGVRSARVAYANELQPDTLVATFKIAADKVGEDEDGDDVRGMVIEQVDAVGRPREVRKLGGHYTEPQLQNVWRLVNSYSTEGEFEFSDGDTPLLTKRIIVPEQLDRAIEEGIPGERATYDVRKNVVRGLELLQNKTEGAIFGTSKELPGSGRSPTRYFRAETTARIIPTEGPQDA